MEVLSSMREAGGSHPGDERRRKTMSELTAVAEKEAKDVAAGSPTPDHFLQTGLAFWASKTLLSAVEMGVFTELANGPEQFDWLAGRLGLHPRSARDFLDALVALRFLERTGDTYCNSQEADLFL